MEAEKYLYCPHQLLDQLKTELFFTCQPNCDNIIARNQKDLGA